MTTKPNPQHTMAGRFCWKPDVPDHRDRVFAASERLKDYVAPMGSKNPVEDQGDLGSCTGNSTTTAFEIVNNLEPMSRLMAYYNARQIEGTVRSDAGASIRNAIKGIVKTGVCTEAEWPYDIRKFAKKPPSLAYLTAKRAISYERVTTLNDLKRALGSGLPVVFGFSVPDYFDTLSGDYLLQMPAATDKIVGAHAVVAVGYSDRVKVPYVEVRNSWGKDWGRKGNFRMTQDWFTDPRRLVDDLWVLKKN